MQYYMNCKSALRLLRCFDLTQQPQAQEPKAQGPKTAIRFLLETFGLQSFVQTQPQ